MLSLNAGKPFLAIFRRCKNLFIFSKFSKGKFLLTAEVLMTPLLSGLGPLLQMLLTMLHLAESGRKKIKEIIIPRGKFSPVENRPETSTSYPSGYCCR